MKKVLHLLFVPIGGAIGYWMWRLLELICQKIGVHPWGWVSVAAEALLISVMAVIGYLAGRPLSEKISGFLTNVIKKTKEMPAKEFFLSCFGLLFGCLLAFFVSQIFRNISNEVLVTCLNVIVYLCFAVLGVRVMAIRRDDIDLPVKKTENVGSGGTILDASILIDGRTMDIFKTGFLIEPIYIPKFVLNELTRLSDSQDDRKRSRGRIGMDTVKKLRDEKSVILTAEEYEDLTSVDDKMIAFAKEKGAAIMTNDYSLNMVASLQGVKILNINELVNALKPTVVAGDELTIEISKIGKDPSQGVGYLDDGTMVVVEDGSRHQGEQLTVTVTSMLQTNAGKIIFGRIKNE